jgi:hypothetical protein
MVVYNTYLDKVNKTRKILRADMTDENGMLTVTLTVPAHLIQRHAHKILPSSEYLLHILKCYQKPTMTMVTVIKLSR